MNQKIFEPPPGFEEELKRRYASRKKCVDAIAAKFNLTRSQVLHHAVKIGLSKTIGPQLRWLPAELQILQDNLSLSPRSIRRKLKQSGYIRSEAAISATRRRLGLPSQTDSLVDEDVLTLKYVADALHISHKTVYAWVKRGWLVAKNTPMANSSIITIEQVALRRFFIDYITHVPINESNKVWIFDMLGLK